jgi:chemotaxis regulatin CheY-phosphate phosphatase CheZ
VAQKTVKPDGTAEQRGRDAAMAEMRALLEELMARGAVAPPEGALDEVKQQVDTLQASMEQLQKDVAALRPREIRNNRVAAATGELGAIVTTAEQATFTILDATQQLSQLTAQIPDTPPLGELRRQIDDQVTAIMTACSFQDLTGQRTAKVVTMLRILEERLNSVISLWKDVPAASEAVPGSELEGPHSPAMSPTARVGQDDVDSILGQLPDVA